MPKNGHRAHCRLLFLHLALKYAAGVGCLCCSSRCFSQAAAAGDDALRCGMSAADVAGEDGICSLTSAADAAGGVHFCSLTSAADAAGNNSICS